MCVCTHVCVHMCVCVHVTAANYLRKANALVKGNRQTVHSEYKAVFVSLPTCGETSYLLLEKKILKNISETLQMKI